MTRSRSDAEAAATAFIDEVFPDALVALLAGSASRGEITATSDLDLVLLTDRAEAPYRETFHSHGWPIKAFVYTAHTYGVWFGKDVERRRPSLPTMCLEAKVLKDEIGLAETVKFEAKRLLEEGPPPLTDEQLDISRYRLTDLLQDLETASPDESLFIAITLVPALADLVCDLNGSWRGEGKWLLRALSTTDAELGRAVPSALRELFTHDRREPLIELADDVLQRAGGRLFAGYAAGKEE